MSTYKCERCGMVFDEPYYLSYRENLDGEHGWATRNEALCPNCGSDDIEKQEDDPDEI